MRHFLILYRADSGDAAGWPRRNVLLVEFPGGDRWTAEVATEPEGSGHDGERLATTRLATASRAVEAWRARGPAGPCGGERVELRSGEIDLSFFASDGGSRTVKTALRELREASFSADEMRELSLFRRLRMPEGSTDHRLLGASRAWETLLLDRPRPGTEPAALDLVPDSAPPGDLEEWRSLLDVPSPLEPMGLPEGLP